MTDMYRTDKISIFEHERIDEIGFGNLKLIQAPEEFCYGVDAVLLADFAYRLTDAERESAKVRKVIDLGTGTGVIPLILSSKYEEAEIFGVEVQEASFLRAERNAELNGLSERLRFINADIKDLGKSMGKELAGSFDTVVSNPPYTKMSAGLMSPNRAKHIARHETTAGLEDFISVAAKFLKPKGDFFMVHRPSRLSEILIKAAKYKLEAKNLQFVSPRKGDKPNIMLIHFIKGGNPGLNILEELAVHNEQGGYTKELEERYK